MRVLITGFILLQFGAPLVRIKSLHFIPVFFLCQRRLVFINCAISLYALVKLVV